MLFSITFHIKISETCCIDISKSFVGGGGPVDYQVHPRHAALLVQPGMIHYELYELWYIYDILIQPDDWAQAGENLSSEHVQLFACFAC